MSVTRYADPDEFLRAALPVVAHDAAAASFFKAMAQGVVRNPPAAGEHVYLATCRHGDDAAVAAQRGETAVVIDARNPALAGLFADDLAPLLPQLQGVGAALPACDVFARRWRERTSRTHVVRVHLRHHVLTEVRTVPGARGRMREANGGDLEWLTDASLAFIAEVEMPDAPARVRANVPRFLAQGRYRIWDDGGAVAFAGWNHAGDTEARVGPVHTLPHKRRQGYATALVADLSRELIARGKERIFLVTDLANPTSNAIYAKIGYRALSDFWHYDFVASAE